MGGNLQVTTSSNDPVIINTANAERMRVDAAGQVGIGTSSPNSTLHVFGSLSLKTTTLSTDNANIPDDVAVVFAQGASPININLPQPNLRTGRTYMIRNTGSATVTVNATSLDGGTQVQVNPGGGIIVVSAGSTWYSVASK
jgi:hypothetical protein